MMPAGLTLPGLLAAADPGAFQSAALIMLCLYLCLLLALGFLGWKKSRNTEEDYYLAGRNQGWIVSALTIMATFFSSFAFLGQPGLVYKEGVAFALFALNVPVAAMVVYLVGRRISAAGRRHGHLTPGDMICHHYGNSVLLRILVALVGFLYAIPYVVIQLNAGGIVSATTFPDPDGHTFLYGTYALAGVTVIYIMVGGMRSVAWTDVIQGILLIGGMLLAGIATIAALGGIGKFLEKINDLPPEMLSLPGRSGGWPATKLMTVCVFAAAGSMIQPAQWMRYYSAKSGRDLKRSALLLGIVLAGCSLFGVILLGLGGEVLYPAITDGETFSPHPEVGESVDQILVVVLKNHVPNVLGGGIGVLLAAMVCVAIMAASMSTADSNLHAMGAVFTRDIYARLLKPSSGDAERTWVGRAVILAATFLAVILIRVKDTNPDFEPFKLIAEMGLLAIAFSSQLLPITIDMLFLRRGNGTGAIWGLLTGLAVVFFFTPFFSMAVKETGGGDIAISFIKDISRSIDTGAFALVANVSVFALVSRLTGPPKETGGKKT
ncbi:MAG: sodium:solute symporter family protein [Planctomycetota bacterium]|nr:hypothetical protein [Planctomycetota bacterium]MBL04689.1 hypothetical protein [Planctomycetota bacterium]MEE3052240.1 sodium:solute symporter family protein [Planctomycetota bacterium]